MRKVRKGKKILIIILIAIIVIVAAAIIITKIVKKKPETPSTPVAEQQVITLPETKTNSGMDVQNVYMEYLKDNNETMITMRITNTTSQKVKDESFNAVLIGPDDNILGSMPTGTNVDLNVGEQCEISVIYKGDLTSTKKIKLEKIQ